MTFSEANYLSTEEAVAALLGKVQAGESICSEGLLPPVYDYEPSWHAFKFTRFTDSELAAEVHRASAEVYRAKVHGLNPDGLIDRFMVLSRFARLPHFDEVRE